MEGIEEKKKKIQDILLGKGTEYDSQSQELQTKTLQIQEERIQLGRKIKELRHGRLDREAKFQKLENEIHIMKKESLIGDIISMKRTQAETRMDMQKMESDEIVLLTKLEMIRQEKEIQQKRVQMDREAILVKVEPDIKLVKDESIKPLIEELVDKENIEDLEIAINREVRQSLRRAYKGRVEQNMNERAELLKEKYEIEARLQGLRPPSNDRPEQIYRDVFRQAENMNQEVDKNIFGHKALLSNISTELHWLDTNPSTDIWKSLKNRVDSIISLKEKGINNYDDSRNYLDSQLIQMKYLNGESDEQNIRVVTQQIFHELLDETVSDMLTQISRHHLHLRSHVISRISAMTSLSACQSCYGPDVSNTSTGRIHLARECWIGMSEKAAMKKGKQLKVESSQSIINVQSPLSNRFYSDHIPNKTIEIWKEFHEVLESNQQKLKDFEMQFWEKVHLPKVNNFPLLLPPEIKILSLIRLFSRPLQEQSLLIAGSQTGRIAIWSIYWTPGKNISPTLLSLSPKLPSQEEANLVDIQEPNFPTNQLVTIDEKGAIRVWILNPPTRKKSHIRNLFPKEYSKFAPVVLSCAFYLTPTEFNLPIPTSLGFKTSERKFTEQSVITPQYGAFPQRVAFFPSFSFTSRYHSPLLRTIPLRVVRQSSLLVGCMSGELLKINYDFKEKYFASHLTHPPRFVDVEFMHSASFQENDEGAPVAMIQASGDDTLRGNMVYRELFHYHRAPIIFIGTVNFLSLKIITIDTTGEIAIWHYHKDYFRHEGWFTPFFTASMDLRWLTCTTISNSPPPPQLPHPSIQPLLKIMKRRVLDETWLEESYCPLNNIPSHPSQLEVVYKCKKPLDDQAELAVQWSAENVHTTFQSACVLNISHSGDGQEIVFVATYSAKETSQIKSKRSQSQQDAKFVALICLNAAHMEFHSPTPKFEIESHELVNGVSVGPVNSTTLTRVAFVLTDHKLRCFSLETGQHIKTSTLPLVLTNLLPNLTPMLGSICPLHRVAAFGAPDDRRIAIHLLCVDEISTPSDTSSLPPPEILKGFRRSTAILGRLVLNFIPSKKSDQKIEQENEISQETKESCEEILNLILVEVFILVDQHMSRNRIHDLYGTTTNLGIVTPSEWPHLKGREGEGPTPVPAASAASDEESEENGSLSTSSGSDTDDEEED